MLPYFIYITSSFLTPNLFSYMAPFKSTKPQGRLTTLLPTHHLKFYTPRYHIFLLTHFDTYKFFSKRTLTWVGIFKFQNSAHPYTFDISQHHKFHQITIKSDIYRGPAEHQSQISRMTHGVYYPLKQYYYMRVHCTAQPPVLSS